MIVEKIAPIKPVDLQLPSKGPVNKSYAIQLETPNQIKEEVPEKPKPKWVSAFQAVDDTNPTDEVAVSSPTAGIKSEPIDETPSLASFTAVETKVKEPAPVTSESKTETEKIVTLKSEKSSSKKSSTVFFKKRKNDGQNMRERLDD